jgi:thioredoxin:protein disulfide reductase
MIRSFTRLLLLILLASLAQAQDLLEPEKAFRLSVQAIDANTLELRYRIANGYYVYRERFKFEAAGVEFGPAVFPSGEVHNDQFFGRTETYRKELRITLPVTNPASGSFELAATSQGCADAGICYPPFTHTMRVALGGNASSGGASLKDILGGRDPVPASGPAPPAVASRVLESANDTVFAATLESGAFWKIIGLFFIAGLALTFTPCVLPMIPILAGIVVGAERKPTRGHAFALSLAYVLGMAVTYTLLGIGAALSGSLLSAALQNPWVLGGFAAIFVLLALSMFGFYELQLPSAVSARAHHASSKLSGGRISGVVLMGVLSAAIVSPCVAAPLAGALLYISQTRDVALGGTALFAMALGMGLPLMAIGTFEGALLPRAGHWMNVVKHVFGVLLLAVAIWIVTPILPAMAVMLAWAALLIVSAMYLRAIDPLPHDTAGWPRFFKGLGVLALVAGAALVVGAMSGSQNLLAPLAGIQSRSSSALEAPALRFERVKTIAELEARVAQAGKPALLDFYADWCVSCKEMERYTFSDPLVRTKLGDMLLLQADVTGNDQDDKALLKRFRLFGPPGIIFFDRAGRERTDVRVIGYQSADRFAANLDLMR